MVKRGSSRFWGGLMVFWLFQEQISALNKGKFIENGQTGLVTFFWGRLPHNSGRSKGVLMVYQTILKQRRVRDEKIDSEVSV